MKTDCIFFKEKFEELPEFSECLICGYLCKEGEDDMCKYCRLWDNYIPIGTPEKQIEKALEIMNLPYDEIPDYEDRVRKIESN